MIDNKEFMDFCIENHLSVTSNDPQSLAVNSDNNTVVSAGAGTGKTTVLSFRFLRLVMEKKAKPSEILTITFTRKATAEMKQRIYILMQQAFRKGFVSEEDFKDFSNCTISTVDSFCTDIVRKNSVMVGVSRDFGILSDDDLEHVSEEIVMELLHQTGEKVSYLLKAFSVSQIKQIFRDLAKDCLNIANPIEVETSLEKLKNYLEDQRLKLATQVKRDIDFVINDLSLEQEKIDAVKRIYNLVDTKEKDTAKLLSDNWSVISKVRKDNGLKAQIKETILEEIPACIQGLLDIDKERDILLMAQKFEERIFAFKRSKGLLTFSDIMQLSLQILTNDLQQRNYYSNLFKFIMIDEFQDNNDDYRKLLFLLSGKPELSVKGHVPLENELEENKIFLVGDQKQSIYRFRGAEVSVFKKLSQSLCKSPIELVKNWRSEPQIINFCNYVFAKVMANLDHKDFEADFSALTTKNGTVTPCIELITPKENQTLEEEAKLIALKIKEITSKDSTCLVPDKDGSLRPPKYSEIGILLRSSSGQSSYEEALNALQIPFSVTEPKTLPREALANDFYCALMTVLNPYDRCAYASLLKSHFFNIKDENVTEALEKNLAGTFVASLSKIVKEEGLLSSLIWLWNNQGYRSYILSLVGNRSYTQHFDWLYAIACDLVSQGKTVVDFTDLLREYAEDEYKKLPQETVFEEETQGVQIMTIHKSKGLAFEVVFVCGMDAKMSRGSFGSDNIETEGFLSMRYSHNEDTLINPVEVLNKANEVEMENAETKRVFYVALTRAKYHIFMTNREMVLKTDQKTKSMLNYLVSCFDINEDEPKQVIEKDGFTFIVKQEDSNWDVVQKDRSIPTIKTELVRFPKELEKVSVTSLEENEMEEQVQALPMIDSDSILDKYSISSNFGTRVHSLIESALSNNTEENKSKDFYPKGLSEQEIETLENDAKSLADNFLNSTYLKQMQEEGYEFFCEKPLVLFMENENKVAEGRIDLLCISKEKVEIVDFKTDRFKSPQRHKVQLQMYKTAIEAMPEFKDRIVETNVVYLRKNNTQ